MEQTARDVVSRLNVRLKNILEVIAESTVAENIDRAQPQFAASCFEPWCLFGLTSVQKL